MVIGRVVAGLALVCLMVSVAFSAGPADPDAECNGDPDRSKCDSTELVQPPAEITPKTIEALRKAIQTLKAEDAVLAQRDEEIMIETASRPGFHARFAELKDLSLRYNNHNQVVKKQREECQGVLKAQGDGSSRYAQCYHKYVTYQNKKQRLEKEKAGKLKEIFGHHYDEWQAIQDKQKIYGMLIRAYEEAEQSMAAMDCGQYLDERSQWECGVKAFDGGPGPAGLPRPNFRRKINYILQNQPQIIADDLSYEDLP